MISFHQKADRFIFRAAGLTKAERILHVGTKICALKEEFDVSALAIAYYI